MLKDKIRQKILNNLNYSKIIFWSSLSLLVLSVILTLFYFSPQKQKALLFFYNKNNNICTEIRFIVKNSDKNKQLSYFIDELIAGADNILLYPFLSKYLQINSISYNNSRLYIDGNEIFVTDKLERNYSLKEKIYLLKKNIKFNYPYIHNIFITIGGKEPRIST